MKNEENGRGEIEETYWNPEIAYYVIFYFIFFHKPRIPELAPSSCTLQITICHET